jgi:hypothetical protein
MITNCVVACVCGSSYLFCEIYHISNIVGKLVFCWKIGFIVGKPIYRWPCGIEENNIVSLQIIIFNLMVCGGIGARVFVDLSWIYRGGISFR